MDLNHTYDKIRYFRAKIIGLKGLGFALHGPIKSLAKMSINISFIISKELSDHTNHLKKKKKKVNVYHCDFVHARIYHV